MSKTTIKKGPYGRQTTWIQLEPGETALIIRKDRHYKLGGQVDDVVSSHVLEEATEVSWCSVSQEWAHVGNPAITPKHPKV